MDTALQMLKQEAQEGVGKIILTPHQKPGHWCVTAGGIEKRLGRLQKEAENLGIPVWLYPGAELMYCRGMRELLGRRKSVYACPFPICAGGIHAGGRMELHSKRDI